MDKKTISVGGLSLPLIETKAVVVGSGCAGWNAADCLAALGVDTAVVTEGVRMGTSRNTGSDKQTYYKLSLASDEPDSVGELAKTLFSGGGVDGDTALCEAAGSVRCFMKLVQLGVPFPTNRYGEYAGYRTDHDPRRRATSCGPLTSKRMTEALEASARRRGVPVLDRLTAVRLLTDGDGVHGLLCLDAARTQDEAFGLTVIKADAVVLATGGPAIVYFHSVYPKSQTGMTGMALEAGAAAGNLQEWQYGLASTGFRWNVSGTYQQVLPRYISVDARGNEREFLAEAFGDPGEALGRVFLKGYQWPFDAKKANGSSLVDLLVHREIFEKGNRVFLDYRQNPRGLEDGFSLLPQEARDYLEQSGALFGTPVERLARMNPGALRLYAAHGIDLRREPLAISVCAQHCNGGLEVDENWQTTVNGLYAAGEAAGTFGVYRPGGSALNSTQVGSLRAAEHIALRGGRESLSADAFRRLAGQEAASLLERLRAVPVGKGSSLAAQRKKFQLAMSKSAAHLRGAEDVRALREETEQEFCRFWETARISSRAELPALFKNRDMLLTQQAVLSAMETMLPAAKSRGSALAISREGEELLPGLRWLPPEDGWENIRVRTWLCGNRASSALRPVRPIPEGDQWFERVWRDYRALHGEE